MKNSSIFKVIFWLFCFYVILCPFYVFPSGTPQPADFILALNGLLMLFVLKKRILKHPPIKSLISLVILIAIVNGMNQLDMALSNIDGDTSMSTLFYIFNCMAFIMSFYIIKHGGEKAVNFISLAILISISIQCLCSILGLGSTGGRGTIFFNNPNQLGYYALCSFTLFAIIPSKFRRNKISLFFMIGMCCYLMLVSESRAALIGVALLTIVTIVKENFKIELTSIFTLLLSGLIIFFFIKDSKFIKNQIDKIETRNENKSTSFNEEIKVRGYDRIILYSDYIWYGAGEGGNLRFKKAFHQGEIHSGLGTILFSYGILGLILFFIFLFRVLKYNFFNGLVIFLPILLYNLTHQGLRDSFFWVILSFIYYFSIRKNNDANSLIKISSNPRHNIATAKRYDIA